MGKGVTNYLISFHFIYYSNKPLNGLKPHQKTIEKFILFYSF